MGGGGLPGTGMEHGDGSLADFLYAGEHVSVRMAGALLGRSRVRSGVQGLVEHQRGLEGSYLSFWDITPV